MKKSTFLFVFLLLTGFLRAQCTAPSFTVDLSAQTDTTWILSGQSRSGVCCGSSNCVTFTVKTNPGTELISFDVTNPSPSGSAYYQVNCGTPVSIGTPLCIVGLPSPFTITYCKPGGDHPDYIITAGTVVHASDDISIQKTSCVDTLTVTNVTASSVQWTSIYPGTQGAYNSYLSCTSGCTSTLVTPGANPPPYVDYMVSGTPNTNCGASFDRDTVRVYFVANLSGTITPTNPIICASSGTQVTLTANASGGATPYNYVWSTGPHTQSINVSTAGTYTVTIGDNTKCPKISITKTISTLPSASFSFTGGAYCKNGTNPTPTYSNNGQPGSFSASPAGLVFVSTSTGEINLAASAAGTYTVTNFIASANGCPNVSATATVTINPFPTMTSASTATICTGSAVNINLSSSVASTYTWIAADNLNTTGESLSTQTTSTLNNTLINSALTNQVVVYTVTPTAISSGGCVGTSQTVSVTVRPKDDASFTYSSSTFCQTGTFPSASITGLTGGTFTGSAGLVFANASNGTINLSSTGVGSFTVTYTTNGPCPNAASFPVTITLAPSATFSFTGSPYCQNASNPLPTFASGASGGTFTSQSGLVFVNSSTGEVNLASSTQGTYTVTNSIPAQAGCAAANATATITITQLKNGAFSYTGSPYCQSSSNPSPTFASGAVGGTFSSQAGLSLNSGSGLINLAGSTPGTYTVTNTLAAVGGCPAVINTAVVTVSALPVATFTYTGTPYCNNGSNPVPTFMGGGVAGSFNASSVFININSSSGVINLANSVTGSFTVTNTIPAANGCPQVSASAPITITPLPLATFSFTASPYCQNSTDPTPLLTTGGTNGNWTASPTGLDINSSAGTIVLANSTPGSYTVTNTISAMNGCPSVIATNTVAITALPIGNFTYAATPYCANQSNPLPTFTGGGVAGSFSSQAGLNLNSTNGQITLAGSTPGTYTVTNSIAAAAGCPVVDTQAVVVINGMDDPSFVYSGSTFCQTGTDPSPTITLAGGTFSSDSLIVDPSTGVINLGASPLGTFTVGYTTNGACPNSSNLSITITNAPSAAFSYTASPFCTSGTNPIPTFPVGSSAGVYSATPTGLSLDAQSGQVALSTSTANTYTVTNTIAASGGCAVATATTVIQINQAATANADLDQIICFGNTVNLNGAVGGGANTGSWSGGNGSFTPSIGTLNATYSPTSADSLAGVITLTLTTDDPAGVCPAVSDVMSVTINQPATANASVDQTVCYGTNILLAGAVGGSATSATWTGGTGSFTPNDTTLGATYVPSAADSAAGGATLTLTTNDPAGVCLAVNDAMIVTINQPATANASVNQTICFGTPVILAGAVGGSATSGTWSGGNGSFSPDNTTLNGTYIPTSADSATGISVLVLTSNDPAGICPAVSDTMVVTINQPATANASSDQTICFGTQAVLTGNLGGSAGTATWTGGNGTYSPNDSTLSATYIPTSADSATGTITLTLTTNDPIGVCPAVSDVMSITINQPATVNANADQTICYGTTVTLNGGIGGSATSATWTGGSGIYAPANSSLNASYSPVSADSTAGTISLVLTTNDPAGICPAVTDTMKITINQPATVSAGNDQTLCYGATVNLNGTIGGSASVGTWTGGTGTYSPSATTPGATYTPSSADSLSGTITLTFTTDDPTGVCPSMNDAMNISLNQPPTVNASADQSICYGTLVSLNGSIGGSATSATWSGGTGSYAPDNGTLNGTYTPSAADSAAGVVTFVLTTNDPAGICTAVTDTMKVTISQPATVNASGDQTLCYGTTVSLNGTIGGSATSASWSGGAGSYTPNNTTLNATYIPTSADSTTGTITLVLTTNDPAGVCQAVTDTMKVTLNQPATANASGDQTTCYGGSVTLNGVIGGSAISASWSGGTGTFAPNANTLNASYTPSAADSLSGGVDLILTTNDPSGICNAGTDTMHIVVNPLPTIPSVTHLYTYCQSQLPVTPITANGNGTIIWSTSPTMLPVIHVGATYSPGTLPVDTTVFYILDTLATGCKSSSVSTVTVIVNATPNTPTLSPSSTAPLCANASPTAINSGGSSNTIWSTSSSMNPIIYVGASYTPAGLTQGSYTFYAQDSTVQGCKSVTSGSLVITVHQNPSLTLNPAINSANCGFADGSITVAPFNGTSPYSYQWYNGSTLIPNAFTNTLNNVAPGSYSVNVVDANGCPAVGGTYTFSIGSTNNISSSFTATTTQGSVPLDVLFTSTTTTVTAYNWSLGNGTTTGGSPFSQTTYTAAGTYTVMLTTSYGTCVSTSTLAITVEGTPDIVIPNIFSPNGDNINDQFTILTVGVTDLHADIFNRWGTLIHTLSGVGDAWDGKSNGNQSASEGTYYIILTAKTVDGKTVDKQGFVTLVR